MTHHPDKQPGEVPREDQRSWPPEPGHPQESAADEAYLHTRKYRIRWWTLAVLSLSLVIIGLDNTIVNIAIPTIQEDLNATASQLQWIVDSYTLVFAGMLLTMGALGDRFGRKLTLQAGLVIFAGFSLLAAYSGTANILIVARGLMGLGGALIMPSTLSIITDVFPREERVKAIGVWAGMAAAGIAAGPALGGLLLNNYWWGSIFLINIPVAAVALAAGLPLVPSSRARIPPLLDPPGSILSIVALFALVFAIIEIPMEGWLSTRVIGGLAIAVVVGAVFAVVELRAREPMLRLGFFGNPRFSAGVAAITTAFFCLFGQIFIFTQYLQFVHGYSPLRAGLSISPYAIGMLIGSTNSFRFVRRIGTNGTLAMGLGLIGLVMITTSFWGTDTSYWFILATILVVSFGISNTMTPATDAVMGSVPLAKAGVGSAMNDTTRLVGGALGVAIIGSVLNTAYTSGMQAHVAGLPPSAAATASNSIGGALIVAGQVGGAQGQALFDAARSTFTNSMGIGFIVTAVIALAGAGLIYRFMPAHHLGRQTEEESTRT